MRKRADNSGVVGHFNHLDDFLDAARGIKPAGVGLREVFTPVPVEEAFDLIDEKPSPVPFFTFAGGLAGLIGGFALGIGSALVWDIVVGGKPVASHVPFVVIAFEGMILLGALATFAGIMFAGKLPFVSFPGPAHRPEFTEDQFGIWLSCPEVRAEEASRYLREKGAFRVSPTGKGGGS